MHTRSSLPTSFLKHFQNCSRMPGQDSLPMTTPQELWEHDNFPAQEYSENLLFIIKSTILQGIEVRFTGSSSPWALLQVPRVVGNYTASSPVVRHKGTLQRVTNLGQHYLIQLLELIFPTYFLHTDFTPWTHRPWGMYPVWECLQRFQQCIHQSSNGLFCYVSLSVKSHLSVRSLLDFSTNSLPFSRCI